MIGAARKRLRGDDLAWDVGFQEEVVFGQKVSALSSGQSPQCRDVERQNSESSSGVWG